MSYLQIWTPFYSLGLVIMPAALVSSSEKTRSMLIQHEAGTFSRLNDCDSDTQYSSHPDAVFFSLVVEMKHSCLLPKKFTSSLSGFLELCSPWIIAFLELKNTIVILKFSPCLVLQMERVRNSLHTSPKQDDACRIELLPIEWQPSFCKSAFNPIHFGQRSRATGLPDTCY